MKARSIGGLAVTLMLGGVGLVPAASPLAKAATTIPSLIPLMSVGPLAGTNASQPPTSSQCLTDFGIACYGPPDMATQYNFTSAYNGGATGQGQSIVIFDSYGSPTIQADLATFDQAYHLPAPPSFNIYEPEGHVTLNYSKLPSPVDFHNKNVSTEIGWAYETTLDVEWAHAMAPGAAINLVVVPVAETQGVQGLQNLENAQRWALDNHLGNIWSNSFATTEQAFHNSAVITQLNGLYAQAQAAGITTFFASGDTGVQNTNKAGAAYPYPTVNYPSSSPNVISVGGTEIPSVPPALTSYTPESVWNDGYGAGGGGFSSVFPETVPQVSAGIADQTGARGLPDVSYNAAVLSAILIYESFDPTAGPGWVPIGGTSAATPQWAAVDAVVQSGLSTPVTNFASTLYSISTSPTTYAEAFHDITTGNNSFGGVTGYNATAGWDPASGLGTPNVGGLMSVLQAQGS